MENGGSFHSYVSHYQRVSGRVSGCLACHLLPGFAQVFETTIEVMPFLQATASGSAEQQGHCEDLVLDRKPTFQGQEVYQQKSWILRDICMILHDIA